MLIPTFPAFPLQLSLTVMLLGRLCIYLIFITKFLVGTIELRGLSPINYLDLPFPKGRNYALPAGFQTRPKRRLS